MSELESSVSFPALGSVAFVAVEDPRRLADARAAVAETVVEFDIACSRFREDSELCALNAAAGSEVRVSPLLLEAVGVALRAARLTDGDVDPTVGEALIALGYDRDFGALEDAGARAVSIASVPGWRTVRVDLERSTIRVARGVKLDLGATAKALAADRAAARAGALAGCGVLVGLGGDIATFGPAPGDARRDGWRDGGWRDGGGRDGGWRDGGGRDGGWRDGGWRVRVTDDHRAGVDAPGQWISIRSGGLATSSTTVRRWRAGSGFAHHVVDPATGAPVDAVWRTVSVTAASCLDANIASTAAIVRGAAAAEWLASLGLPSRLVSTAGTVTHVAGWPASGDDLEIAGAPAGGVAVR
jgi:thiamine biosynthesis lipoprotein